MELVLKKLVKETLQFAGMQWDYVIDVTFSDAMLKDLQQNTQMYIDLYTNSLVSQETAIWQIFSRDQDMVQQELTRIKQENNEKQQKQIELSTALSSLQQHGNHWSKQK